MLSRRRLNAFFLPMEQGTRFCLLLEPVATAAAAHRGAVLFVHPFAEEMNNSRRIAALQARAFADAGWTVLQIDLFGCGDSASDFPEATWQRWLDDVRQAAVWLRERTGHQPILWGLRAGCLLALQAARDMQPVPRVVLWQPVTSGKQFLQQFLRLRVAQQIVVQTREQFSGTGDLREQLARGKAVEVAGYTVSPALACGLEAAELEMPRTHTDAAWIEISRAADLSPVAQLRIKQWREAGHSVESRVVQGSAFWQIPGVGECPALIQETLAAVDGWRP